MSQTTRPDDTTKAAEKDEATTKAGADRPPTAEEEARAEQHEVDPDVAAAHEEANRTGADVKGEGQIEP